MLLEIVVYSTLIIASILAIGKFDYNKQNAS